MRAGINLGPVRLVRDINSQPNIIGDGINVAQRVMSFAQPTQVLVSRSYYDVVTRISEDYARIVRLPGLAHRQARARARALRAGRPRCGGARDRRAGATMPAGRAEDTLTSATQPHAPLLRDRRLALAFTGSPILALGAAAFYYLHRLRTAQPAALRPRRQGPPRGRCRAARPVTQPAAAPSEPPAARRKPHLRAAAECRRAAAPSARGAAEACPRSHAAPGARPSRQSAVPPAPVEEPARRPRPGPRRRRRSEAKSATVGAVETHARACRGHARPSPAPPRPDTAATALVQLAISPWGEVFVDGKSAGVSPPMAELELSPASIESRSATENSSPIRKTWSSARTKPLESNTSSLNKGRDL